MIGVSIITFSLVYLTPGDPVDRILGLNPDITPQQEAQMRSDLGFDEPVYIQYFDWLFGAATGDFGEVYSTGNEVSDVVWDRLPETIAIGIFGWVFAIVIAIPTGIYAAYKKGKIADTVSRFIALAGISIPNFWLGLMLIMIFALQLDWWRTIPPSDAALLSSDMLWFLILPGITIGTASAASLMRVMRTSMSEELNKEYVTAARAKGLPERTVVLKHVLRNSLISVVTLAAVLTASIISGSVVVEYVFNWPGLGREFIEAIQDREMNLIMAITLLTGLVIVIANLIADIIYAILDPRIRYE